MTGVILDNGKTLATDIVVVGIGIVPNVELAEACGLEASNGIVVDDHCRTSDPEIYAIGDCTWHPNALLDTCHRPGIGPQRRRTGENRRKQSLRRGFGVCAGTLVLVGSV